MVIAVKILVRINSTLVALEIGNFNLLCFGCAISNKTLTHSIYSKLHCFPCYYISVLIPTTVESTIGKLNFKTSLLCMGYVPQKFAIATDNGSGFTSATFNEFINHNGI